MHIKTCPRPAVVRLILPLALAGVWLAPADLRADWRAEYKKARAKVAKWVEDGSAAGNEGDYYENRDGDHSPLNVKEFFGLKRFDNNAGKGRRGGQNWGLCLFVRPNPTVGNSSTSSSPTRSGSNARSAYCVGMGLKRLWEQYTNCNLYIYPEHRDYDPGRFGQGGHGDLFPTNTPFVIISRGSSGSDQPFMRAALLTMAAFRPEVKKLLVEKNMLMPTLQMIFRRNLSVVRTDEDYLTGKAHPTAFSSGQLRPVEMVEMAQAMTLDALPPFAMLAVVSESDSQVGRDYLVRGQPENRGQCPALISRVYQAPRAAYRFTLSAENSGELKGRPLSYHWAVLRGDPNRVQIKKLNDSGSRVEVIVPFHEPFRAPDAKNIWAFRVDVGCFVHNGTYYSPPSFLTVYMPPQQVRTIGSDGRVVEIAYGRRSFRWDDTFSAAEVGQGKGPVNDWVDLLAVLCEAPDEKAKLLADLAGEDWGREQLLAAYKGFQDAVQKVRDRDRQYDEANKAFRAARKAKEPTGDLRKELNAAREQLGKARAELGKALTRPTAQGGASVRTIVLKLVRRLVEDPRLVFDNWERLGKATGALNRKLRELEALEIVRKDGKQYVLVEGLAGRLPDGERLSAFEKIKLAELNADLLNHLTGRTLAAPQSDLMDRRVFWSRSWRDVYRYSDNGTLLGWSRIGAGKDGPLHFDARGRWLKGADKAGRGGTPTEVIYRPAGKKRGLKMTERPAARRRR